jgi:hypothetical protein
VCELEAAGGGKVVRVLDAHCAIVSVPSEAEPLTGDIVARAL